MSSRNDWSQLDPSQAIKDSHDFDAHALRVKNANSQVPGGFSKVDLTYNVDGSVTKAVFYKGTSAEKTEIKTVADVGGSLNSKYFLLYSADDGPDYYVWYNVSGTGVDPNISGKCGIEIPLQTNDIAEIVARATAMYVNLNEHFKSSNPTQNIVYIENYELGQANNTVDVDTGFSFVTKTEGETRKIKCIELPYANDVKYEFNLAEGKFELIPTVIGTAIEGFTVSGATIQRVSMPTKNTEYDVTVPVGTKRFELLLEGDGFLKLAFASGQSGTNYRPISPGAGFYERDIVLASPLTLYFQSNKDSQTAVLVSWT